MLRGELGSLILRLWQTRRFTAVMVTHNIAESILMSHRIAVMRNGSIESVIENPLPWPRDVDLMRTPEFASFFGDVSDALRFKNTERRKNTERPEETEQQNGGTPNRGADHE